MYPNNTTYLSRKYEHRKNLIELIDELGYRTITELGVGGGDFSSVLAKSKATEIVLVDKWNDHHDENEHQRVVSRFKNDRRIRIFHDTFENTSKCFSDEYFDFIYIDGYAHTGQDNGLTLDLWWPKVKIGGFFGGHDYHVNYPKTIMVVDAFCSKNNKDLHLTGEDKFPSWYVFK